MPRFFVPDGSVSDNIITISGDDARHIALSLRMAVGDGITVCDYSGNEYVCTLLQINPTLVRAEIRESRCCPAEPKISYVLYQALPKGDKMDTIVQKSVECGVRRIVPLMTERCISRPDDKSFAKKLERWNRISREAAGQCGRGIIPSVEGCIGIERLIAEGVDGSFLPLFFYEGDGTTPLPRVIRSLSDIPNEIRMIVGSEGGFSADEAKALTDAGYIPVGLGKRILRCETAAQFVLACFCYEFEMCGD